MDDINYKCYQMLVGKSKEKIIVETQTYMER
jgi:hypothetical protein